jgi:hypothetical protein
MLDEMRVNDEQLEASDIRQLESADEIAHFFARLRYNVDERTNIPDYAVLGMGSEDMRQHIHRIELIGKDPADGDISIDLFEVRSVTAKLRNDTWLSSAAARRLPCGTSSAALSPMQQLVFSARTGS